jgi:hypothetical protein
MRVAATWQQDLTDDRVLLAAGRSILRSALSATAELDLTLVSVILIPMETRKTIEAFDGFLVRGGLLLEAVVIGGAALNLMGVIARPTNDCDVLHPTLPRAILDAAVAFAAECRLAGEELKDDWLNNGPSSLTTLLPPGWEQRTEAVFSGAAISLRCLGRADLLRTKLFALCDRGLDLADCVALAPSASELEEVAPWVEWQDANPNWPAHVRETLAKLGERLGHGV